jgi:D-glycero-D-manno-heptose 1,7-bisphosphate phosphatase
VKLVILDRDGVINRDSPEFVKSADEWLPIPGSIDAIAALSRAGFQVAVASNQSGLARGLFNQAALEAMHQKMCQLVAAAGGEVNFIAICPHGPDDGCDCRKPKPGLLRQVAEHFGVTLDGVPVIGDSLRDIEAALAAGARPVLVKTGNGLDALAALPEGRPGPEVFADLSATALALIGET